MEYINLNVLFNCVIPIPSSSSGDTVTYVIYKASDGSTFQSGSMTFVADEIWKCSFTPVDASETYILKVNDTTIESKRENFYQTFSAITPSVITPSGDDLTTIASFKNDFGIPLDMVKNDTMIQMLITANSLMIKKLTGRTFAQTVYDINASTNDILYDVNRDQEILLRQYPIISVASVNIDWDMTWGSETLIDPSNYVINPDIGMIRLKYPYTYFYEQFFRFSPQAKVIQVLYTSGYNPLPNDLISACEKLVMADYLEGIGSVNVAASNEVIYKPDKLRKTAMQVVDSYKSWFSGE